MRTNATSMSTGSRSRPAPASGEAPVPLAAAPLATVDPAAPEADEANASGALSRLGRWLPRLAGLRRFANRTAVVSAICASILWWALARGLLVSGAGWLVALVLLAALLVPAGAAWLLGLTLHDIMTLPERLRTGAVAAAAQSREAIAGAPEAAGRMGLLLGAIRAIWAARGFVLESKGAWAKAATAVRVVRLAKLPFALGLLGLFALNIVVVAAGLVALAVLVLV